MKPMLLLFFICLLATSGQAQETRDRLEIQLSSSVLQPGDSMQVSIAYTDGTGRATPLATVELVIQNEQGARSRLRWPVINGAASGTLYLSDSLPRGRYTLVAGLQQRFFEVVGLIREAKNVRRIQAMLLAKGGDWEAQEVPVQPDGTFSIRNWLFEDNALMAFSDLRNSDRPLDIRISTELDSTYEVVALAGRSFYVGEPSPGVRSTLGQPVAPEEALFAAGGSLLPAVEIRTTSKSRGRQFEEMYSRGMFASDNARLISILDDPSAIGFGNVLSYLQGRVAGLRVSPGGYAVWRGSPVAFFIDELRVSGQQVATLPMADVAIVKAYTPPFLGAPGGAIAIYTRRGGERDYLPSGKQVFRVKGYTPASIALDMSKAAF